MTYYVYVLRSLKDGQLYIGMTNNIKRRLYEHNLAYKGATKGRAPYVVVFWERYVNRVEARKREKYLKSGIGRELIKKVLRQKNYN